MIRKTLIAAGCAALFGMTPVVGAADQPADTVPLALARDVANKTIELVETRALYPRQQAEYAKAKAELLAVLATDTAEVDRSDLYARIPTLLRTLDVDGHSMLVPAVQKPQPARMMMPDDLRPPMFKLVTTTHGTALGSAGDHGEQPTGGIGLSGALLR